MNGVVRNTVTSAAAPLLKRPTRTLEDSVWAVYSYFYMKQRDQLQPSELLRALKDLVTSADALRGLMLELARKLDVAHLVPAIEETDKRLLTAVKKGDAEQVLSSIEEGANVLLEPSEVSTVWDLPGPTGNSMGGFIHTIASAHLPSASRISRTTTLPVGGIPLGHENALVTVLRPDSVACDC